ncbi:heme/steroid binding protein [Aspergillus arachidicola]|uniref:Heme/steroid binding protein n=1 Tax=Aspergillus arachidicola TaxID=656916 RepID=A0A2G7ELW7_9EURO|nr:heme/steroid binding protein [Aspergillus arachidicola]
MCSCRPLRSSNTLLTFTIYNLRTAQNGLARSGYIHCDRMFPTLPSPSVQLASEPSISQPPPKPTLEEPPTDRAPDDATVKDDSKPLEEKDGNTEDFQTTPKAFASSPPSLEVPTLHLNSDKADKTTTTTENQADKKPIQNGSAKPSEPVAIALNNAAMPPPPQPTASSSSLMPPPPPPRLRPTMSQPQQPQTAPVGRYPPRPNPGSSLRPPPSAAASLRVPPSTSNSSKRAVLEPGYSPLDWAALTSNPKNNLRGANLPPTLVKVTPSMLKVQNGRKGRDAWTSYQGKVYNITPYVPFHPGGKGELLRGAGKDSAKLFMEVHPWVNWDAILGECLVGILVSENDGAAENALDAMD